MPAFVRSAALGLFLGALISPLRATAQSAGAPPEISGRGSIGGHLQVSVPRGDFAKNTNTGFGIGGYGLYALDEGQLLNLRADLSFVSYANARRRIPLPGSGGLIQFDLRTSSTIASVLVGPQIMGPPARVTPYATALGGFSVFTTQSTVEGSNNTEPFASTTNANDVVWAYGGAVGTYVRLTQGRRPVRLDIGARYLRHDDASYLTDERVTQGFNTNRPPVPVRSRADFMTYYLGVNVIAF